MNQIINDREAFAQDLRTLADRIEDGEYDLTQMAYRKPAPGGEPPGKFTIKFVPGDELERMAHRFAANEVDE